MRFPIFWVGAAIFLVATAAIGRVVQVDFYVLILAEVLQLTALGTAWNILGGYGGYINFGSTAFVALGAYTSVFLNKTTGLPLPGQILAALIVSGGLGFGLGAMTMRLRGIFFAIATMAVSIILETVINNWDYMGGSRGIIVMPPQESTWLGNHLRLLMFVMAVLAVAAVASARHIQTSRIGRGLHAIRDDEVAAESLGVPTLRLKLIAASISGAFMGALGAMVPLFMNFIEPASLFSLNYAMLPVAIALVGGTSHWMGPIVGALLLGSVQRVVTVTVSSDVNALIIGVLLVLVVVAAPQRIVGPIVNRKRQGGVEWRTRLSNCRKFRSALVDLQRSPTSRLAFEEATASG